MVCATIDRRIGSLVRFEGSVTYDAGCEQMYERIVQFHGQTTDRSGGSIFRSSV